MVNNEEQVKVAENIVQTFAEATGWKHVPPQLVMTFLLCDLMHYAATLGEGTFEEALEAGRIQYGYELIDDDDDD